MPSQNHTLQHPKSRIELISVFGFRKILAVGYLGYGDVVPGGVVDDEDVAEEGEGGDHHQPEGEAEGRPALARPLALRPGNKKFDEA